MKYNFLEKNPQLQGKSDEYIMAQDYTVLNGVQAGIPYYDYDNGGRKTLQKHLYKSNSGRLTDAIVKVFTDVFNEEGVLVACQIKHIWVINGASNLTKIVNKELNSKERRAVLEGRRKNVRNYILDEAEKAINPLVIPIFDIVFSYLNTELSTWLTTGKVDLFYYQIDNAPTAADERVTNVFADTPYEGQVNSIADLFELDMEKTIEDEGVEIAMKLNEYLKHYIK